MKTLKKTFLFIHFKNFSPFISPIESNHDENFFCYFIIRIYIIFDKKPRNAIITEKYSNLNIFTIFDFEKKIK